MELLTDKIKERLEMDDNYSIEDLSKEELMTLWYEEGNADHQIADLFNLGSSKVFSTRKRKGVMKKFITKENEEKRMEFWYLQNQASLEKVRKLSEMKSLFRNENWLLGVLNVFSEDAKSINQKERKEDCFRFHDNRFIYDYTIYRLDHTPLSFTIAFREHSGTICFNYQGKDYGKGTREILWSFFQAIERKLRKIGFDKVSYVRLPESAPNQEMNKEKLSLFKEDMGKETASRLQEMNDDEFIKLYTDTHRYQYIHYLGEHINLSELDDLFVIKEIGDQHYGLKIKKTFLEGKTNKEHYLLYEKAQSLLSDMNLCVFAELSIKESL